MKFSWIVHFLSMSAWVVISMIILKLTQWIVSRTEMFGWWLFGTY